MRRTREGNVGMRSLGVRIIVDFRLLSEQVASKYLFLYPRQ